VKEAAIDCKNIATQKIVTLPLSQKLVKEIHVLKKIRILASGVVVSLKRHFSCHVSHNQSLFSVLTI